MTSSESIEKLLREGHPAEALALADAVVASYRDDHAVPRDLAHVEKSRGDALRALDRMADAAEAYVRSRDRLRFFALVDAGGLRLHSSGAEAGRPTPALVRVLLDLGRALYETNRYEEALVETAAALEAVRALSAERALLAEAHVCHGTMIARGLGEEDEAEIAAAVRLQQQGIALYRTLAAESPARYTEKLAHALRGLGLTRGEVGHHEAGSIAYEESASLFRGLEAVRPGPYLHPLADVLVRLAGLLVRRERPEEALGRLDEAITLLRTRLEREGRGPDAISRALAAALDRRADVLHALGRFDEEDEARSEILALSER